MKDYNFTEKAKRVHGNIYDYSLVKYKNSTTKVCIICPVHGEFWQYPSNHISGKICLKCSYIERIETKRKNKLEKRFSKVIQPKEYKLIPLTQGKFAKVDNEDFDKVRSIVWSTSKNKSKMYAVNDKIGHMHRYLMSPPKDKVVDHINGDGLDNRRSNLRVCTQQQNSFNSKKTGYYFSDPRQRWVAEIKLNGRKHHIGVFKTESEAKTAHEQKSKELFGEYHYKNAEPVSPQQVQELLFGKEDSSND